MRNAEVAREKGADAEAELRAVCEDVLANLPRSHTEPRKSKVAIRQAAQFEKMVGTEYCALLKKILCQRLFSSRISRRGRATKVEPNPTHSPTPNPSKPVQTSARELAQKQKLEKQKQKAEGFTGARL